MKWDLLLMLVLAAQAPSSTATSSSGPSRPGSSRPCSSRPAQVPAVVAEILEYFPTVAAWYTEPIPPVGISYIYRRKSKRESSSMDTLEPTTRFTRLYEATTTNACSCKPRRRLEISRGRGPRRFSVAGKLVHDKSLDDEAMNLWAQE